MERIAVLPLLLLAVLTTFAQPGSLDSTQMAAELDEVHRYVRYLHPDAYAYRDSAEIAAFLRKLKADLPDSASLESHWRRLDKFILYYNDAHTRLQDAHFYQTFLADGGRVFPAQVKVVEGSAWSIYRVDAADTLLQVGDELLAINGVPAEQLLRELRQHAPKESRELDDQDISESFPYLLWKSYGWSGPFRVAIRREGWVETELQVPGMDLAMLRGQKAEVEDRGNYQFKVLRDSVAYLYVRDFYSGGRSSFRKRFRKTFRELRAAEQVKHLILDFRGHDGGDPRFGEDLARYFADQPFLATHHSFWKVTPQFKEVFAEVYIPGAIRWLRPLYVLNRHTRAIWRADEPGLVRIDYDLVKPLRPKKQFQGEVYLLTDHDTFSAGSLFADMFRTYDMGTIVGSPSGNLTAFYADPLFNVKLPHSGLRFRISSSYNVGASQQRGVQLVEPDVRIAFGEDALQRALLLIEEAGR